MNAGHPSPLGATWIAGEDAWNFAVHSQHAESVTLLLYARSDPANAVRSVELAPLVHKTGRVWHARIPRSEAPGAELYAYRVDGPKILLDPYAPAVHFPPEFSRPAARTRDPNDGRAVLGVLPSPRMPFDWGDDAPPRRGGDPPELNGVIYELHVKGFTKLASSGVSAPARGTYAGLAEKIPYLRSLGVTAVELLPVHQYDTGGGNFWGYMTLHFFSPHLGYSLTPDDPAEAMDEFRRMVKALHAAGIEVILDVVYNHTAESDILGPTYGLRGLDDETYYLHKPDGTLRDDAGAGNVLNVAHPVTRRLILDSLRFWVREMHVDGFRFDLATIFTRREDGTADIDAPPLVSEITDDPVLRDVRLIAEPWDLGSYQLGKRFPGRSWLQWNDRFRDDVRSFVRGEPGRVAELMSRVYGSSDFFPDGPGDVFRPYQSVNFVTCHDGFSLYDLVAYDRKHNEANGESNRDGTDENRSWNCGVEGDEGATPEILALRRRQAKNFLALLMVSNGTPMLRAGDELLASQGGNNNAYNQDNETSWIDWTLAEKNADVLRFVRLLVAFRRSSSLLSNGRFWRERITWHGTGPIPDWSAESRSVAFHLRSGDPGSDAPALYVMASSWWEDLDFTIQGAPRSGWRRVVDTALASPRDILGPGEVERVAGPVYRVKARSVVVLASASS